jgi:DNA-binding transcriptional LysR family regulator
MTERPAAIEIRHLRYFLAVIEELHFRRAAERLHIAQPPLSQAIRKLESELGVQLFNRTSRVVTPTEAGRALATEAANVVAAFDRAIAEARRAGGLTDLLRVGCVPHLPLPRLQAFLAALNAHEPRARPRVTHLPGSEQIEQIHAGALDLGIFDDVGEVAGVNSEPLFEGEPICAFVPPGHALAEKTRIGPADLRDEVLVTPPREGDPVLHDRVMEILEQAGFAYAGIREASSRNGRDIMLAVAGGLGLGIGPASYASASATAVLVTPRQLSPSIQWPDTVIAWHDDPARHLGAILEDVREIARQVRSGAIPAGAEDEPPALEPLRDARG